LYTLIGGVRPQRTLPMVLDVGTNNAERLNEPEYIGWPHERITGQEYFDFIDQFAAARLGTPFGAILSSTSSPSVCLGAPLSCWKAAQTP
jgi:Malic enzyme, N-terminal domain